MIKSNFGKDKGYTGELCKDTLEMINEIEKDRNLLLGHIIRKNKGIDECIECRKRDERE